MTCSAQVTEILRHEHFLAQLHRARFEKLLQRCPYLGSNWLASNRHIKKKNPGNKIAGGFLLVECLSFFVNFCAGQVLDRQSLEVLSLPITDTGWWQLKCFWNFHPEPWGNDPICGLKPPPREGVIFDM